MVNLYDNKVLGRVYELKLNTSGSYDKVLKSEITFNAYIEDVNDTSKLGIAGVEAYYDLKLIVSKNNVANYKALNYINIDGLDMNILKSNYYKLGNKSHVEFIVGLEVPSYDSK